LKIPFLHILISFLFSINHTSAQTIFPGLEGEELLDSLVARYKTNFVLSYDNARDTLFSKIQSVNDSLTCVYTGYKIYLDLTQDPTQNAASQGIDTEHIYPQSKGAVGQARSDMHHLFPTRMVVNSSRGNDPFSEIPDQLTTRWFRLDQILTGIPQENIDEYSEKDDNNFRFEPRENFKGDVARAIFYFYTMYRQEANNSDPQFFDLQKDDLYLWHKNDAATSIESDGNEKIAFYQEGKRNPFILDSSLVRRAYFSVTFIENKKSGQLSSFHLFQNYPNPFNPVTTIKYILKSDSEVKLTVYDLLGKEIKLLINERRPAGYHEITWNGKNDSDLPVVSGIYIYRLGVENQIISKKMILLK
jgi:hypothetical protein